MNKSFPVLEVDLKKIRHNVDEIVSMCDKQGITVFGVVKGVNGILPIMREVDESGCSAIASSRLEHIENAREAGLRGPFFTLRVPMLSEVSDLVRLCDGSLNSEPEVLKAINAECAKQKKIHKVILMADLGDLREGFWNKDEMIEAAVFAERELTSVHLYGIGTNLGCYGSIKPTAEKMEELIEIAERIEAEIGRELEIISGGATSSLPLVMSGSMPKRINNLRIGEGILPGKDLQDLWGIEMSFLHTDMFTVKVEIIEIKEKPSYPQGEIFVDAYGNKPVYTDRGLRKRALLGIGKLDVAMYEQFVPRVPGIEVLGGSSDHLIIDITDDPMPRKVGDILEFDVRYSTMMYTSASKYIRKQVFS